MSKHWEDKYVDSGENRPQDDVALNDYLRAGDRAQLRGTGVPFFSGRESIINMFRQSAAALAEGQKSNATIVVEGPPGCGKSALLEQFSAETHMYPDVDGKRWIAVPINGSSVMSPSTLMLTVDNAIAKRLAQDAVATWNSKRPALDKLSRFLGMDQAIFTLSKVKDISDRGLSVLGVSVGAKSKPVTLEDVESRRGMQWASWNIVLMIDEAQGISADVPRGSQATLATIHQGLTTLPLIFCAFGLYGTMNALRKVEVSRLTKGHYMRPLALDSREVRMAVRRAFKQYGVRNSERWEDEVVERSKGWPQHLAIYLQSALESVRQEIVTKGIVDVSGRDLRDAMANGDEDRSIYYGQRLSSLESDSRFDDREAECLARILLRAGDKELIPVSDLSNQLMDELGMDRGSISEFLLAARHCGLLGIDEQRRYFAPIPSFLTYLTGTD